MTEHRAGVPQTLRLIVQKTVFFTRTHTAGRAFRTQRQAVAVTVFKGVHFFFNDIGHFTDRTFEQRRLLQYWHTNFVVSITSQYIFNRTFKILPDRALCWQYVVHTADCLNFLCHV